jgi:hypothetical protein
MQCRLKEVENKRSIADETENRVCCLGLTRKKIICLSLSSHNCATRVYVISLFADKERHSVICAEWSGTFVPTIYFRPTKNYTRAFNFFSFINVRIDTTLISNRHLACIPVIQTVWQFQLWFWHQLQSPKEFFMMTICCTINGKDCWSNAHAFTQPAEIAESIGTA